jgi:hypothetical protein
MNHSRIRVLGTLLLSLCLSVPAQSQETKTWHLSAMALGERNASDFQDFQLQSWGLQLESSLPFLRQDLRLGGGISRANSAFQDPVKTVWLRQYAQQKMFLRLQYHVSPFWQIRPFVFAGAEKEKLNITYSNLERRNFTAKRYLRPLLGVGLDLTIFRFVRLRLEGSYGNGIQTKLGLGVCWAG